MKNILVTGGAGFIGSNLVRYLQRKYSWVHILNLDALTYAGTLENLGHLPDPDRHTFILADIRDRALVKRILEEYEVDTIVHLAAESHVDRSISGPSLFLETNVVGTFNLLEAARQVWGRGEDARYGDVQFHHVSTDEVYGSLGATDPAFTETTRYSPNSPYAATKASADHLVRSYGHTYGLPVTITNCSNNYGPNQHPEKLVPLMIQTALRGGQLPIYGDGKQIRDWLYVEDHCEAISLALEGATSGSVYNVGGENQPTNLELVTTICEEMDIRRPDSPHVPHKTLISHVSDRPGHDRRYAMNTSKIREELGWKPRHNLQEGLRKTIDWYLANPDWVRTIEQGPSFKDWIQENYSEREEVV